MMCDAGDQAGPAFSALLEDSAEDLYEHAPCGYLSTLLDGSIAKINARRNERFPANGRFRLGNRQWTLGSTYWSTTT